ncbi:hypothetical protein PF005_g23964 [Phytophthora fragariae]|uniref:Uncharacterized protein n=1 Tax=Phytophthora fragariae TaxID=53985 RepID=A0A6A3W9G2_9STRA|nr:hypothetical protein PF003_g25264 [Phytophthora fragariae]KAE8923335.1 hypothetical protein PF009_g26416 [Phytophthora fragariae]KAE8975473.1 hypothetical protein PF011_g24454 [Phytophthora fragariae]KAE9073513.1 hypothetical protein PF007_g25781 [Phytophthora fragariae]KAE9077647.1 hypothetical protein PF010_g23430 [Phytophthora fragariae]
MTISTRIRGELFVTQVQSSGDVQSSDDASAVNPQLIRLPLTRPPDGPASTKKAKKKTKRALTQPLKAKAKPQSKAALLEDRQSSHRHGLPWTTDEHDRFLQGLERYPSGPWKAVAAFVGTRTPRQTMTHAQKYRQKIQRRRRGLMTSSRQPVPETSAVYCGLVITTSVNDCDRTSSSNNSKSPTAVDATDNGRMAPLEPNWFDKVQVGELDAAFRAFLEVYDPTLFPMDDDTQAIVANTFTGDMDSNVSMLEDCTSIVL